jgi:hypothetical protein
MQLPLAVPTFICLPLGTLEEVLQDLLFLETSFQVST